MRLLIYSISVPLSEQSGKDLSLLTSVARSPRFVSVSIKLNSHSLKEGSCAVIAVFLSFYSDMVVSCNYSIGDVEGIGNDKKTGRGAMKYEIQRRSTCEPEIWFTVAEAGLKIWSERIARALKDCEKGEYRVWENK